MSGTWMTKQEAERIACSLLREQSKILGSIEGENETARLYKLAADVLTFGSKLGNERHGSVK